jgi:excisionase family DNA binding protein
MSNNSTWLTKAEAAERLGVSLRSVERYAAQGRLVSGRRDTKHGKQVLFDAESLDALKAELTKDPSDVVLTDDRPATSLAKRADKGLSLEIFEERLSRFSEALTAALAQASTPALLEGAKAAPSVPIADKLTLSLKEAAALAGFSRAYLLEAIHTGELKADKRAGKWNVKRSDLDSWVKRL